MTSPSAEDLRDWTKENLGSPVVDVLFRHQHLSSVSGAVLADGRKVVVKSRPWHDRVAACFVAQQHAFAAGFPCPEPLVAPVDRGGLAISAEALVEFEARPGPRSPDLVAAGLVRMIRAVTGAPVGGDLEPPPPWVWWDHPGGLWPAPDDRPGDLNGLEGPGWLDDAARRVKSVMADSAAPRHVVGHGDWEDHNLRWSGEELVAVYDWDSIASRPEAALAGAASAVFSATGEPMSEPAVEASDRFLTGFALERGEPFTPAETRTAWAAGLWVRAFNAKKEALADPSSPLVAGFEAECNERLERAEGA